MDDVTDLVDRYFAMWNTTDAGRRHELVREVWTDDARYADPRAIACSPREIETMVSDVRDNFPEMSFRRTGPVESHNGFLRYPWQMVDTAGAVRTTGMSFARFADGRLRELVGFFDEPAAPAGD